jgi:hypothetical protein
MSSNRRYLRVALVLGLVVAVTAAGGTKLAPNDAPPARS